MYCHAQRQGMGLPKRASSNSHMSVVIDDVNPQNRGLRRCWAPAHSTCCTVPSYKNVPPTPCFDPSGTQAEFLDGLKSFSSSYSQSLLYSFALIFIFIQTHATCKVLYTVKEKGGKPDRKPYPHSFGLRNSSSYRLWCFERGRIMDYTNPRSLGWEYSSLLRILPTSSGGTACLLQLPLQYTEHAPLLLSPSAKIKLGHLAFYFSLVLPRAAMKLCKLEAGQT